MRTTKILTLFLSCSHFLFLTLAAQDKWDLRRCVEYAMANNISIKQADIDSRTSKLTYEQSKWSPVWIQLMVQPVVGLNFGRSIDPTTNIYSSIRGFIPELQSAGRALRFLTGSPCVVQRNPINSVMRPRWSISIKLKMMSRLNVAAGYLTALLSKEQVTLAKTKLDLTRHQLENTRSTGRCRFGS